MTGSDDELTAALARTLRHHAAEARSTEGLPEKAMAVVSRRRRHRVRASIAAVVVLAVGIPVAVVATVARGGGTPSAAGPAWRWESYRGVEVQVPPDWGYGVPGRAWCAGEPRQVRPGAVGRPGLVATIGCPSEYPPVHQRENWLTFDSGNQTGERHIDDGWVEETRRVNGVFITVFTNDDALRSAVLGSAQPVVGADRHGCMSDHPAAEEPNGYRPDTALGGLPPARTVESISVCRYATTPGAEPPLLSSSRITGVAAKELVAAIQSALETPDTPGVEGREIVVLCLATTDGGREVVVHYSGGTGNGFDDGTTRHQLTAAAIRPLLTGANSPTQVSAPVAALLPD